MLIKFLDGTQEEFRADLSRADLSRADLSRASLSGADLSRADLSRASLSGANLSEANLSEANLSEVNLSEANLFRANLSEANLSGAILTDGIKWEQYLEFVVPKLLTAGGKTLNEIISSGCWECHSWDNCPMHVAFGIRSTYELIKERAIWKWQADRFIQFFDAGLIPVSTLNGGNNEVSNT